MSTVLQINNLTKQYGASARPAVDGISFSVTEGELFCLLGVNGAGKSTTINILCTLLKKTTGEVTVCGHALGREDEAIRRSIGAVFQSNVLDDVLTVEENLLCRAAFYGLSRTQAKERIQALAQRLTMTEFLGRRYGKLSGGQRRKGDIARALLAEPKILFLDEPTTGLDPQSRLDLWNTIDTIRKTEKMTVFLTTHYMEETESADRIAIIDGGKILCLDTPQRLKSAHSSDILRLIPKAGCEAAMEKHLADYERVADTYILKLANGVEAIGLLGEIQPYLDSFELEKGSMDHVFLNVVGRKSE